MPLIKAVTMTNLYSSLDMTSLTSPNKVKRIAYELMQDQGIELTKEEIYDMEEHHAGLERSMDMVPGLTVMGGEQGWMKYGMVLQIVKH